MANLQLDDVFKLVDQAISVKKEHLAIDILKDCLKQAVEVVDKFQADMEDAKSRTIRYFVADVFRGDVRSTNDRALALQYAGSEDAFVIDSDTNEWLISAEEDVEGSKQTIEQILAAPEEGADVGNEEQG